MKNANRPATSGPRPRARMISNHPSPWQSIVIRRMDELGITTRALAAKISTATRSYANSSIWFWTKNAEGCPQPATYTTEVNLAMAKALNVSPDELAAAYDASRTRFHPDPEPQSNKRLAHLRRVVAESPRQQWPKQDLIAWIDDLLNL